MVFLHENDKFYTFFNALPFYVTINLETRICMADHRGDVVVGPEGLGFEGRVKGFCFKVACLTKKAHCYLLGCGCLINKWKRL